MWKRGIFAAVMAILLVAGMCSSAACEMMCAPSSQTGACCPQQTRHAMDHCTPATATIKAPVQSPVQCAHSQDGSFAAFTPTSQALHLSMASDITARALLGSISDASVDILPAFTLFKRSSTPPLRI
jgi:hypothetical protein